MVLLEVEAASEAGTETLAGVPIGELPDGLVDGLDSGIDMPREHGDESAFDQAWTEHINKARYRLVNEEMAAAAQRLNIGDAASLRRSWLSDYALNDGSLEEWARGCSVSGLSRRQQVRVFIESNVLPAECARVLLAAAAYQTGCRYGYMPESWRLSLTIAAGVGRRLLDASEMRTARYAYNHVVQQSGYTGSRYAEWLATLVAAAVVPDPRAAMRDAWLAYADAYAATHRWLKATATEDAAADAWQQLLQTVLGRYAYHSTWVRHVEYPLTDITGVL